MDRMTEQPIWTTSQGTTEQPSAEVRTGDTLPAATDPVTVIDVMDRIYALPRVYQLFLLDRLVNFVPPSTLVRLVQEMETRADSSIAGQGHSVEDGQHDHEFQRHQRQNDARSGQHD